MSINFDDPMNEKTSSMLKEMFGEKLVVKDQRQALIDSFEIQQKQMKEIANTAKQPATVELHDEGDIKTMSDGTRYQVTPQGWKKLEDENGQEKT